jgi:hypothetical protein
LDIEDNEKSRPAPIEGKRMNQIGPKKVSLLVFLLILLFSLARCAATQENLHAHGDMGPMIHPKGYVYPMMMINFEKVAIENRGLRILKENATTVNDFYRGGVQEKEEGERLMKEKKWSEAEAHFEKSNWFLEVVVKYFPEDEAERNIYDDHTVIFLPNLLVADNQLKLMEIYSKTKKYRDIYRARRDGRAYLSRSLRSVKTEWAYRLKKDLEEKFKKEGTLRN